MRDLTFGFLRRRYPPEVSEPLIASGYFAGATGAAWREVMSRCRPALLARVQCPVLLLNGQYDQFRLGERGFRQACPQATVEVLPGATHLANLDRPRNGMAPHALRSYLATTARRRAPTTRRRSPGSRSGPG